LTRQILPGGYNNGLASFTPG